MESKTKQQDLDKNMKGVGFLTGYVWEQNAKMDYWKVSEVNNDKQCRSLKDILRFCYVYAERGVQQGKAANLKQKLYRKQNQDTKLRQTQTL